jgi:hypothetical protein
MCNTVKPQIAAAPAPSPEPLAPAEVSQESQTAKAEQIKKSKNNQGRKRTILTSSQGIKEEAKTAKKTLLGQ